MQLSLLNFEKEDFEYLLNRSARKLKYKSKRTIDYINKLNNNLNELNNFPLNILSTISSHKFYIILRNILRDLLIQWYSFQKLSHEEYDFLRNSILFFNRLINTNNDMTKFTIWLIDPLLINSFSKCLSNIDQLFYKKNDKHIFKQLIHLFDIFSIYYERISIKNELLFDQLFESTMDCLMSLNYDQTFRKLNFNNQSMTSKENFFLIKCPAFINSYHGSKSKKIIEQILDTMIPRYALLLDQHIKYINQWNSSIIHAVHHLLLTVIYAKDFYTPYASGQPLQWLIDHIIRIISESSFIKKVNEKSTNLETILIDSSLRTLTAFVREPDLLVYMKYLKITSIFRSLILVKNESIVLHSYVMLSYTLEEYDIKTSEKYSGRLLSKIFDSLRKKLRLISLNNQNADIIERHIFLLIEALQALVQHDQIKSEILKQNALSLLIDGYQHFNYRSKRLLLESLGSITFDQEAARLIRHNTQFINSIKDIQTTTDDGMHKAAEKIIWNTIEEYEREKKITKENTVEEINDKSKKIEYQYDIMISYCHVDKEVVYRIHKFLSENGFKIWFDRDNIYGPAMQAMADAVENSEFILLCVSDSYKRSVYCQAEAEYAFRCKRHLLPCIVRQGYRADGWLGLIIGSRIYVDFGRVEFKNGCELILKEITLQRENQLITNEIIENENKLNKTTEELIEKSNLPNEYLNRNTTQSTYRLNSIEQWISKDVLDFLYDTKLYYMMPICELMTGLGLLKFFRICQTKVTKFYRQLNEELKSRFNGLHLPIGIFTQFLSEMDRLIHSSSLETIEQDALQSKSVSSSSSSPINKRSPSPPPPPSHSDKSLIRLNSIASSEQIISPMVTTIQTSRNVQITEKTAYQISSQ